MNPIQTQIDVLLQFKNDMDVWLIDHNQTPSGILNDYKAYIATLNNIGSNVGGVKFSSNVTGPYGDGANRTSGSTYTWTQNWLNFKVPILLTKVYWDVVGGRTYTLYIDGVSMGAVVAATTSRIEFVIESLSLYGLHEVTLTANSAIAFRDGPLTENDIFTMRGFSRYSNLLLYNYQLPILIEGYIPEIFERY